MERWCSGHGIDCHYWGLEDTNNSGDGLGPVWDTLQDDTALRNTYDTPTHYRYRPPTDTVWVFDNYEQNIALNLNCGGSVPCRFEDQESWFLTIAGYTNDIRVFGTGEWGLVPTDGVVVTSEHTCHDDDIIL